MPRTVPRCRLAMPRTVPRYESDEDAGSDDAGSDDVGSEGVCSEDISSEDVESEDESGNDLRKFSMKLARFARKALSGDETARRSLWGLVVAKTEYYRPLLVFTSEIKAAIKQVAGIAEGVANRDLQSLVVVKEMITDEPESQELSEANPGANSNPPAANFHCVKCGNVVMQMRNTNKPFGRTNTSWISNKNAKGVAGQTKYKFFHCVHFDTYSDDYNLLLR